MREIKFRAWGSQGQGMFAVEEINFQDMSVNDGLTNTILMQYTGMHDKNGKEIYEGDFVKARGFEPELHIVRFNRGGFCLEPVEGRELPGHFWPDIKYIEDEHGEVIGNIYEPQALS